MSAELRTKIEAGDLHFLDGLVLLGTIASQRWFGGKSRDVLDARVLDAGIAAGRPADPRLRDRRGALRAPEPRPLPPPARLPAGRRGLARVRDRRGRGLDGLRRDRGSRSRPRDGRADALRLDAAARRDDDRLLGRRRPRRSRRRARVDQADGSGAVEQLGRPGRAARAQALPPDRAGRQPGARAPPLPDRARIRAHRGARGLCGLRGSPARDDARARCSGSCPRAATAGGSRSTRSPRSPSGCPRAPAASAR